MDFSKQPIFAVDYVSAVLMAIALTIIFASVVRQRPRKTRANFVSAICLLVLGSWMCGVFVIWVGEVLARWLLLISDMASVVIIAFALISAAGFKTTTRRLVPKPRHGAAAAIALYFCVTVLIFLVAIFARFYVVRLS